MTIYFTISLWGKSSKSFEKQEIISCREKGISTFRFVKKYKSANVNIVSVNLSGSIFNAMHIQKLYSCIPGIHAFNREYKVRLI